MCRKYTLGWLDQLITSQLHLLNFEEVELVQEDIESYKIKLETEKESLTFFIKGNVFAMKKRRQVLLFLQQHHHALVVFCVYIKSHIGYTYLINGETWDTDYTMSQLAAQLPPSFGFRANRSLMVNWAAIKAYKPIANRQGQLILKYKVEDKINLKISRHRY